MVDPFWVVIDTLRYAHQTVHVLTDPVYGPHKSFPSSRKISSILSYGIVNNVIRWLFCKLNLLYFLQICNDIIS